MKRKVVSFSLVIIMLFGCLSVVNAENSNCSASIVSPLFVSINDDITEYGNAFIELDSEDNSYNASVKEEIMIENIAIALYMTYDNPESALNQITEDCNEIIQAVGSLYNLGEFSEDTWDIYANKLDEYMILDSALYNEYGEQYRNLLKFMDIYENQDINDALKNRATTFQSVEEAMNDTEFVDNLPYYAIKDLKESDLLSNVSTYSTYSVSAAVSYATTYAETPNSAYPYYSENGDCANFASQILYAGGKAQTALWYSYIDNGTWYQSRAWTVANNFANRHGVDYTYSSFSTFSQNLTKGDFICFDSSGDGNWDHVGFVVAVASSYNSSLGYKNFRVAQHSNDYLQWVSEERNSWDAFLNDADCILGIIRI